MRNAGLEETQAGIKITGRNLNNLRYADDISLMAETEEKLRSLLMKVKEESEKCWFKALRSENEDHSIWSHHFVGNRWGNSGNSVRLCFLGSKIIADGNCSQEIKRYLLFGRKVKTNLSSVQFSHSVMSDSLRPHEPQNTRPPCPSPTPGVHSDSHPFSLLCHPAISSSVIPFSSCPQSLPASESFPMSQLFA